MSLWQLTRYDEKYAISQNAEVPCLLLPGWSVGSDIFEWLLPGLAQHFVVDRADIATLNADVTIETLVDALAEKLTQPAWLIGWSMGGNIALELALRYPEKVAGLCLLATSPSFVTREHWPQAMAHNTFAQFQAGLAASEEKTLKRFDLLQTQGDSQEKNLRRALRDYRAQQHLPHQAELAHGLSLLAAFDSSRQLAQLSVPSLWFFGENDALVNANVAETIRQQLPQAEVEVLPGVAHLPFLTATDPIFARLLEAFEKQQERQDKQKVAASFSRAAPNYDASAKLQQWVAGNLFERVPASSGRLLDAGCGTAYWTTRLAEKADEVVALDLAEGMLHYGRREYKNIRHWLAGDLEQLPLADNSVDTIFSSLAVQWCGDLHHCLAEWHRVLKPGGQALFSTLGPKTLYELRDSWGQADNYRHVNHFLAADTVYEQVGQSPLLLKSIKVEKKLVRYSTLKALMKDLKNIGAQTVLQGGVKGLMGKSRFQKAEAAYEQYRDHLKLLPATYEVIFVSLQKRVL